MHFVVEQFWSALMFWNVFFEGAIINIYSKIIYFLIFHYLLCGSMAKRIENMAINTYSSWWKEFVTLEEQILYSYYGKMKAYTLRCKH